MSGEMKQYTLNGANFTECSKANRIKIYRIGGVSDLELLVLANQVRIKFIITIRGFSRKYTSEK
jgi:hypothetical protein